MNERKPVTGESDLTRAVFGIGFRLLEFLSSCGYSVRFAHAGHDRAGDYAFFIIEDDTMPRVALRHLRTPKVLQFMERYLHRGVAVTTGPGEVKALCVVVALQAALESQPVLETV